MSSLMKTISNKHDMEDGDEVSFDSKDEEDDDEGVAEVQLGEIDGTDESGINKMNLSLTLNPPNHE